MIKRYNTKNDGVHGPRTRTLSKVYCVLDAVGRLSSCQSTRVSAARRSDVDRDDDEMVFIINEIENSQYTNGEKKSISKINILLLL